LHCLQRFEFWCRGNSPALPLFVSKEFRVRNFWSNEWEQLKKRGLYWLLLLACVGVTVVVAHQARTVEEQRLLIKVLQSDSQELWSGRIHDLLKKGPPDAKPASPEAE